MHLWLAEEIVLEPAILVDLKIFLRSAVGLMTTAHLLLLILINNIIIILEIWLALLGPQYLVRQQVIVHAAPNGTHHSWFIV